MPLVITSAGCETEATAKRRAEEARRKAVSEQKAAEREVLFAKKLPLDPAPDFGTLSNSVRFHPIRSQSLEARKPRRPDQFALLSLAGTDQPHALAARNGQALGFVSLVDGKVKQKLAEPNPYRYVTLSHDMKHMSYVPTRDRCVIATVEDGVVTPIITHGLRRKTIGRKAIFNDKCVTIIDNDLYTTYSLHSRKVIAQVEQKSWPTPGGRFLLHEIDDGIGFFDCRSGDYKGAIRSPIFQFAICSADARRVAILEGIPNHPQELTFFDVERSQQIATIPLPSLDRDSVLESGWWTNRYFRAGQLIVDVDQKRIIAQVEKGLPISRRGIHGPVWLFLDWAVMIPITDSFLSQYSAMDTIKETILFDNRKPVEVTVEYEVDPPSESDRKMIRAALNRKLESEKLKQGRGGAQLKMVIKENRNNGTFKLYEENSFPPRSYLIHDDELAAEFTLTYQGREMASFRRAVAKRSQVGKEGTRIGDFETFDAELKKKRWSLLDDRIRNMQFPSRVKSDGEYHDLDLASLETGEVIPCELINKPSE